MWKKGKLWEEGESFDLTLDPLPTGPGFPYQGGKRKEGPRERRGGLPKSQTRREAIGKNSFGQTDAFCAKNLLSGKGNNAEELPGQAKSGKGGRGEEVVGAATEPMM